MRHPTLLSVVAVCLLSGVAGATEPPEAAGKSPVVLVLPFATSPGANAWLGRAVQQDLLTDMTQGTHARVLAPADAPAAADVEAALKIARDRGATVVIFGQAQSAGKDVRLVGEVLDVGSAAALGALKATGPSDD